MQYASYITIKHFFLYDTLQQAVLSHISYFMLCQLIQATSNKMNKNTVKFLTVEVMYSSNVSRYLL